MLKIKLANNSEYEVLENTAIYPSYGAGRNKMEIHMNVDSMTVEEFEGFFTEANTAEIHLKAIWHTSTTQLLLLLERSVFRLLLLQQGKLVPLLNW